VKAEDAPVRLQSATSRIEDEVATRMSGDELCNVVNILAVGDPCALLRAVLPDVGPAYQV
jgi:hypothetical protein